MDDVSHIPNQGIKLPAKKESQQNMGLMQKGVAFQDSPPGLVS
jgi:hypothetical protein